jgi:thiamine-monophosphate kinase
MPDEFSIIARLRRVIPSRAGVHAGADVPLGIGDDAAVVHCAAGNEWVLSTDAFVEGSHFLARLHPPDAVGYKALARAASDLAAMGAAPRHFLLTLALPGRRTGAWLDAFARGMAVAARRFQMRLIGGDVSRHTHVVAALTVIGETRTGRALTRSGARPGDALYVSGRLGAAQAGLDLMLRKGAAAVARRQRLSYSLNRHLYPEPRLALGAWLASEQLASAAMDLSDGLSTDLPRLCRASGAGAVLHTAAIPSVLDAPSSQRLPAHLKDAAVFRRALDGGEDYELLFTVPARLSARIPPSFRGVPLTRIGEITAKRNITLLDASGNDRPLRTRGYDHFAAS